MLTETTTEIGRRAERLNEVIKLVRSKVAADQRDEIAAFVQQYFGQVDPEDLAERDVADLYGAAMSHWSFARKREPGHARVRVFNPTIAEHAARLVPARKADFDRDQAQAIAQSPFAR